MTALTCNDGEVYVSVTKYCESNGKEDSYQILDGTTILAMNTSVTFSEPYTNEYCLTGTTNNQYTFKIIDSAGNSWSKGSWVSVAGIYGNIVLKTLMLDNNEEEYALSLYYPVMKSVEWKMLSATTDIASDWYTVAFDESSWTAATLGSVTTPVTGSQYFRKSFAGIPDMAAYEVELNYQYGIVVYVNGVEVFRDHMADGAVTPATVSTDAYDAYEYHGVIRPAGEIEGSNNVLAVELHFPDLTVENAVEFDAYVASIAPSTPLTEDTQCFVYPYSVTLSSTKSYPEKIFNWNKEDYFSTTSAATLNYELTGPRAHINGMRVLPYNTDKSRTPVEFTLAGATSSSGTFTNVVSVTSGYYKTSGFKTFYGYFNAKPFPSYRLTLTSSADGSWMNVMEMQPVTCHDLAPASMTLRSSSYTAYVNYDSVDIRPENPEFKSCSISPSLPAGLRWSSSTCTLSGTPTAASAETTYTMTSVMNGKSYSATFSFQALTCSAMIVKVVRTYKSNAYKEWFTIKDKETQEVVISVPYESGQENNKEWSQALCLSGSRYVVEMATEGTYRWERYSYLYIRAMLSTTEYDTVARLHSYADWDFPTSGEVNVQWSVAPQSQWSYKMSEVPSNWLGASDWAESAMGSFPAATNSIQLYKRTFTIDDLSDVSGFVISLRYRYGCVIYVNGIEVFRNGVSGELSTSSLSSNAYTTLIYHQISLPAKTVATDDTASVNYLVAGSNTIAIAIVAQTASQTTSYFDCAVRLMSALNSRVFDYTISYKGINGCPQNMLDQHDGFTMYNNNGDNYYTITFKNDRREWISTVTVYMTTTDTQNVGEFVLKARNSDSEEWTTLKTMTGLTYSGKGDYKSIWLDNNKPWNQYQFTNFTSGDPESPTWRLGTVDLTCEMFPRIPELAYATSLILTKDIAMTDLYPSVDVSHYYDFTVSPELPEGLVLDTQNGKISGTPTESKSVTTYTITAKKNEGGSSSTTVEITVYSCSGDRSLITLIIKLSPRSKLDQGSYDLYRGKTASGTLVASSETLERNAINYDYFCLEHDFYTLKFTYEYSLTDETKWSLSADMGELVFVMGGLPNEGRYGDTASTTFSSLLPFQIDYSDWKVFNSAEAVAEDWTGVDFDDSDWTSVKAAAMGNHASTTAYIRHEVTIPSIEDYHVLNVRMRYAGGVVAYFNGHIVARFNLDEDFDATTEATAAHDATAFSKFHIVLPLVEAVTGKNVIAFEIHRASGENAIVFDATGAFGVNDCSITLDTYSTVETTCKVSYCTKEDILNLTPTVNGFVQLNGQFAWTVENLEGSVFNSFGLWHDTFSSDFTVYGRWDTEEEYTTQLEVVSPSLDIHKVNAWSTTMGYAGFTQFKVETVNALWVNYFVTQYCLPPASGVCPANGYYPSVKNGEKSVVKCPRFTHGYKYRECANGVLGSDITDMCVYDAPTDLAYPESSYPVYTGVDFSSGTPTYEGYIASFAVTEGTLPAGLTLDATTGVISGKATSTACADGCSVTITGSNPGGSATVSLTFTVLPPSIAYPTVGAGVHVVMGVPATIIPVITPNPSPFTSFEITGLPEGLTPDSATGVITGTASGGKQSVEVTVKGFLDDTNPLSFPFTLFVHDHNSASALVPEGSSPSHILHLHARAAIASGALYLDSAYSAETLALTDLSMDAKEVKGVYAALPDPIYFIQASNLDIVVLKDVNPVVAFIGEDNVEAHFNTTSVCEESLDVECDIVKGSNVIVREVDAEGGNTFSEPAIIPLDRAKSYEM